MAHFTRSIARVILGLSAFFGISSTGEIDAKVPFKQVAKLQSKIPGVFGGSDSFGQAVWIRGNHAFVAAPFATINGSVNSGAIYIYKHEGSHWVNTQIITTGGLLDLLGQIVVDSQGKWLAFSATGTPLGAIPGETLLTQNFTGAVLIYHLNDKNGQWEFVQSLDHSNRFLTNLTAQNLLPPPNTERGASFGSSLSMDPKHGTLLVGAPGQQFTSTQGNPINNAGQVFAFKLHKKKKRWIFTQRISSPDGVMANAGFGAAIRLHRRLALISATQFFPQPQPSASPIASILDNGAVYLYKLGRDGFWRFKQKIVGDQVGKTSTVLPTGLAEIGDGFGNVLTINDNWAIIGAPFESESSTNILRGAAYFYKIVTSETGEPSLQFTQKAFSDDTAAHYTTGFGVDVKKNIAVIGDPAHSGPGGVPRQGGVLVFKLENGVWKQQGTLFREHGRAFQFFGTTVSLGVHYLISGQSEFMAATFNNFVNIPPLVPVTTTPPAPGKAFIFKRTQ